MVAPFREVVDALGGEAWLLEDYYWGWALMVYRLPYLLLALSALCLWLKV